jgi:hypothetical protein
MDVDGPCSDTTLNIRDMQSRLGYTRLYAISVVLDKGEDLLIGLKSLKSMLKNMMSGLMQIYLPMSPKSKP